MVGPWLPKAGLCPEDGEVLGRKQEGHVGKSHRPWLPCGSQVGWQLRGGRWMGGHEEGGVWERGIDGPVGGGTMGESGPGP